MKEIIIKDGNGKILLETKNGRCLLSRFVDMDLKTKEALVDLYFDLVGKNKEETMRFLNFELNEQSFCS